jgi:hypothetical protein
MHSRQIPKTASFLLLALALLLPMISNATTTKKLTDEDLVNQAHVVITGRCTSIRSEWNDDRTKIFTYITISPRDFLKGERKAEAVIIKQPGGEVGEIGMRVDGVSVFEEGEDVLLFLEKGKNGFYRTLGLSQGKFSVATDPASGRKVLLKKRMEFVKTPDGTINKKVVEIPSEKKIFLDDFTGRIINILKGKSK